MTSQLQQFIVRTSDPANRMTEKKTAKKYFRCHAHTNPFRDVGIDRPHSPEDVNWNDYFADGRPPSNIDIGCGYGRFLFQLSELFPEENSCGLEIRDKVFQFVALRTDKIDNCGVIKTNALLFLPNFFTKGSLKRIFVLFPDPHFKKRKQKGRVVCRQTIAIFSYLLADEGRLYISTDVKDLFDDMCCDIENSGFFVHDPQAEAHKVFESCYNNTDEAHRAGVKTGQTFGRVFKLYS